MESDTSLQRMRRASPWACPVSSTVHRSPLMAAQLPPIPALEPLAFEEISLPRYGFNPNDTSDYHVETHVRSNVTEIFEKRAFPMKGHVESEEQRFDPVIPKVGQQVFLTCAISKSTRLLQMKAAEELDLTLAEAAKEQRDTNKLAPDISILQKTLKDYISPYCHYDHDLLNQKLENLTASRPKRAVFLAIVLGSMAILSLLGAGMTIGWLAWGGASVDSTTVIVDQAIEAALEDIKIVHTDIFNVLQNHEQRLKFLESLQALQMLHHHLTSDIALFRDNKRLASTLLQESLRHLAATGFINYDNFESTLNDLSYMIRMQSSVIRNQSSTSCSDTVMHAVASIPLPCTIPHKVVKVSEHHILLRSLTTKHLCSLIPIDSVHRFKSSNRLHSITYGFELPCYAPDPLPFSLVMLEPSYETVLLAVSNITVKLVTYDKPNFHNFKQTRRGSYYEWKDLPAGQTMLAHPNMVVQVNHYQHYDEDAEVIATKHAVPLYTRNMTFESWWYDKETPAYLIKRHNKTETIFSKLKTDMLKVDMDREAIRKDIVDEINAEHTTNYLMIAAGAAAIVFIYIGYRFVKRIRANPQQQQSHFELQPLEISYNVNALQEPDDKAETVQDDELPSGPDDDEEC